MLFIIELSVEVVKDSADTQFLNHNEISVPSLQLLFWFVHYTLTNYRMPMSNLVSRVEIGRAHV
jgi:hypothetical protein